MKILFLPLVVFAYGLVRHAASPAPPATAVQIDHLILAIRDLDEGIRRFEARTGVRPSIGGEHPGRGTRNALVSLGPGLYIEILAPQVNAPDAGAAQGLRGLADLTPLGWAVSVRDVEETRRRLTAAGFALSDVTAGSRERPDGSRLEWQTFGIASPQLAGVPFFIRWGDRTPHPSEDSPGGCALDRLGVTTPKADDLRRLLGTLRLDVRVEAGERGGLHIALRCPTGTVAFSASGVSPSPR